MVGAEVGVVGAWGRSEEGGFEVGWGLFVYFIYFLMGFFFWYHTRTYTHTHISIPSIIDIIQ